MNNFFSDHQARIQQVLDEYLPRETTAPTDLHQAMRYSVLGGGKRLRALLVYATGAAFAADIALLDIAAAAIELIHGYSLIHDDLPAMDNDNLRHGKPSCHKAFNEAIAILAGDALQTLAFELLATKTIDDTSALQRLSMLTTLAKAAGSTGMAGGQALDLAFAGKAIGYDQLETMHRLKTGALISASVRLGALAGNCHDEELLRHLDSFSACIGLAFQIQDDVLDVESSTEILGKTQGTDAAHHKSTYPALIGLAASKERILSLYSQSLKHLDKIGIALPLLRELAAFIIKREY